MTFATVHADPPWLERGSGKVKRGADRHYPLLKTHEIIETMLLAEPWADVARDNAHLYLWVTNNFLEDGLHVVRALGFRYVTNIVWAKQGRAGLGQYFRGAHELCLFGVRGKGYAVRTDRKDLSSGFLAERGRHSEKPEHIYELVEARSHGPYLDMFARTQRPGWTCWGNEITA